MARVPFNPRIGKIKTDAGNFAVDRSFLAHYNLAPAAESADGIGKFALGATGKSVTTGFGAIPEPRNVKITPSAAQVTGTTVKVYGIDFAGDPIDESFTTNGITPQVGAKAFKAVTKIDLPIQGNTPAKQKATVAVTQGAQAAGTTVITFVSAATGTGFDVSVVFDEAGDATVAATAVAAALNANETFSAKWTATSATTNVVIEANNYAAQDDTINLTVKTAGDSDITLGDIAKNTVTGIAEDTIKVGWGKTIGLPYRIPADELVIANLFNGSDDIGSVANSATDLCSNTFAMNGTPDGTKELDIYIIV